MIIEKEKRLNCNVKRNQPLSYLVDSTGLEPIGSIALILVK